jgi:hypothetical protein
MAKLLAVVMFAAVYAASAIVVDRISVYWLELWDPKFGDQAGAVAFTDEVLPILVGLATLLFLAGLSVQSTAVGRVSPAAATVRGAVCGLAAGVLLLTDPVLRHSGVHEGVVGVAGFVAFWAGPAAVAMLGFQVLGPRPPSNAA